MYFIKKNSPGVEEQKFCQKEWSFDGGMADWPQSKTIQEMQRAKSCKTGKLSSLLDFDDCFIKKCE